MIEDEDYEPRPHQSVSAVYRFFRYVSFDRASSDLLRQFYDNLSVTLDRVQIAGDDTVPDYVVRLRSEAKGIIDKGKEQKRSWRKAYHLEKILAHLRPRDSLDAEIKK